MAFFDEYRNWPEFIPVPQPDGYAEPARTMNGFPPHSDGLPSKPLPKIESLDGRFCYGCSYPGDPHIYGCPNSTPYMRKRPTGPTEPVFFGPDMRVRNIQVPDKDEPVSKPAYPSVLDNISAGSLVSSLYMSLKKEQENGNRLAGRVADLELEKEMLSDPYQKLLNVQGYLCNMNCSYDRNISDAINIVERATNMYMYHAKLEQYKKYR